EAPDISVAPDSLYADLWTGEQEIQYLTLTNSGGNDLEWEVDVFGRDSVRELRAAAAAAVAGVTRTGRREGDEQGFPTFTPDELVRFQTRQTDYLAAVDSQSKQRDLPLIGVGGNYGYDLLYILQSNPTLSGEFAFEQVDYANDDLSHLDGLMIGGSDGEITLAGATALRDFYDSRRPIFLGMDDLNYNWSGAIPVLLAPVFGINSPQEGNFCGSSALNPDHPINDGITSFNNSSPWCDDNDQFILDSADWIVREDVAGPVYGVANAGTARTVLMGETLPGIWYNNEQLNVNAVFWLMIASGYPSVNPESGTLPAGQDQVIEVLFDAADICGGDYLSDLFISSNDPDEPLLLVPAHMQVTGETDIALSDSTLQFGPVFIGGNQELTLRISNPGCDTLRVSDIALDHADFSTDTTPFILAVGSFHDLTLTFAPTSASLINGNLSLTSNDPDEPVVNVPLTGEGLVAPEIVVSPDSLHADLWTGELETQVLTIENHGGSDLVFDVRTLAADTEVKLAAAPGRAEPASGQIRRQIPGQLTNPQAQPAGAVILTPTQGVTPNISSPHVGPLVNEGNYGGDHLYFGISEFGEIMPFQHPVGNEHLALGSWFSGYTAAFTHLGTERLLYTIYGERQYVNIVSYTEIENSPNRVVVEVATVSGDLSLGIKRTFTFTRSDKLVHIETELLNLTSNMLTGVIFKSFVDWDMDSSPDLDNWDYDYDRNMAYAWQNTYGAVAGRQTPDIMDIDGWDDYYSPITTLTIPTGPIYNYDGAELLHYELGDLNPGESVTIETVFAAANDLAELQGLVDGAFVNWLSANITSGTVPAGGSLDLQVTFDATEMCGGFYPGAVVIESNDPLAPLLSVPASLTVTGETNIAVSDSALDYGQVFLGGVESRTLFVLNDGCDVLNVSDVSLDNGDFSVDNTSFELQVGESLPVQVSFAPTSLGGASGTLSITSNDPDTPLVT
ncbi:MAG: choice-of-anchor D domain-containing protein, partial [bacterium]